VVQPEEMIIRASPFPVYPGSAGTPMPVLHRYTHTTDSLFLLYQQAELNAVLRFSNNITFPVLNSAQAVVQLLPAPGCNAPDAVLYNKVSHVLSIDVAAVKTRGLGTALDCRVNVAVHFLGVNSTILIDATGAGVDVIGFNNIRLDGNMPARDNEFFLTGISGIGAQRVLAGALFSDGTQHPYFLAPGGVALLPGMVGFESDEPGAVATNADGTVTILKNHPYPVRVILTVRNSFISDSVDVVCNLAPEVGDVDVGSAGGVWAIPVQTIGATFDVPVVINTGGAALGALDLELRYPTRFLEIPQTATGVAIRPGKNWPGGIFEVNLDVAGLARFGGAVKPGADAAGAALEVAVVTFTALFPSRNPQPVEGRVITMATADLAGTPIGGATPRAFRAGNVYVDLVKVQRRRRAVDGRKVAMLPALTPLIDRPRRGTLPCENTPCAACKGRRQAGDGNADCFFDITDVAFLQRYLANIQLGTPLAVMDVQLAMMDADADGAVTLKDAAMLARVNFGNLRHLAGPAVVPVQSADSGGLITISARTLQRGDIDPIGDPVRLMFDIAHRDPAMQAEFDLTAVAEGELVLARKGVGHTGMVIQAARVGPLYAGLTLDYQPVTCLVAVDIGVACTERPKSQMFYYDIQQGVCREFTHNGCSRSGGNSFATTEQCEDMCVPAFKHVVKLNTSLVTNEIGVSVIMLTFDQQGNTAAGRDMFFSGRSTSGVAEYPALLDVSWQVRSPGANKPLQTVQLLSKDGYSPLMTFNNTISARDIFNQHVPEVEASTLRVQISEATLPGTQVARILATDADEGQTERLTFALRGADAVFDAGRGMWNSTHFSLHATSGAVFVRGGLDREMASMHVLQVAVSDNSPPLSRLAFRNFSANILDVNDNNPFFRRSQFVALLTPSLQTGQAIFKIVARDLDVGLNAEVTYRTDSPRLKVDGAGLISVAVPSQQDLGTLIEVTVTATDRGSPALEGSSMIFLATVDDSYLVTMATAQSVDEFELTRDTSGEHPCLKSLGTYLEGTVMDVDVQAKTDGVGRADVTFVVVKGAAVLSNEQVLAALQADTADGTLQAVFKACLLADLAQPTDASSRSDIQFFSDNDCGGVVELVGASVAGESPQGQCFSTIVHSGRVVSCNTDGSVDVRLYGLSACNTGKPALQT